MSDPLILLTNDDGYDAPGLAALRERAESWGRVWTIAPSDNQSGSSHSVTLDRPIELVKRAERSYSVSGTPVDCVIVGRFHLLRAEPDIVISGINCGYNLGEDVYYSGTVAGAREAAIYGIPAVAVSLENREPHHYETALIVTEELVLPFLSGKAKFSFLNVNVPSVRYERLKGVKFVRLGRRYYSDPVNEKDGWVTIGGHAGGKRVRQTDVGETYRGYASVTPLSIHATDVEVLRGYEQLQ